ncbi:MAG: hypothetical protein A2Y64_03295 [Candidatus Coatesbacteria bacterium RBG_13_66_14]|uniref:TonB C-terminal domain-containing protein n=1 Tax=Candidatus Coatesbacteria bacterium RBG_13_66_14 TaxID=1817816 RepID=A0A1F5FF51_9BACT|nr:MAG: hypothetical protein A2Y64_03295 [Candidatus Coatesbacteria bacterium RBG_13_66_14]
MGRLVSLLLALLVVIPAAAVSDFQVIQEGVELIQVEGPAAGSSQRHPQMISEQLFKRQSAVVAVYNEFYFEDSSIVGDMRVMFTLEADGTISGCIPVQNTTGSPELAQAICDLVLTWTLPSVPEAEYQNWVTVTVPYKFMQPRQPVVIELPVTPEGSEETPPEGGGD